QPHVEQAHRPAIGTLRPRALQQRPGVVEAVLAETEVSLGEDQIEGSRGSGEERIGVAEETERRQPLDTPRHRLLAREPRCGALLLELYAGLGYVGDERRPGDDGDGRAPRARPEQREHERQDRRAGSPPTRDHRSTEEERLTV